jgi:hypothetical protein
VSPGVLLLILFGMSFIFIAGYDVGLTDFLIAHCETNEGGSHAQKVR